MHEIYLFKVPETLDFIIKTAPITIMTRSPPVAITSSRLCGFSGLSALKYLLHLSDGEF